MKIIVAYASAGSGHLKAAQAVYSYFKEKDPGLDLKLIDVLDRSGFLFRFFYTWGYNFLIKYALRIWEAGFFVTSIKSFQPFWAILHFITNRINTKGVAGLFIYEQADFIISTHFLPSEIASYLKKSKRIKSKLITVVTDFGVHPLWLYPDTDIYVAASGPTAMQLVSGGVEKAKVMDLGIPVDRKFCLTYKKEEIRKKLGIDPDRFTVLIVTGSFGIGPIEELVNLLCKEVQILAVCAKNKILYRDLKNRACPGVKVFGFVDNMHELMACADMIITKPGGLSIAEILAMELPPVFISAIPGQEEENVNTLRKCGVGVKALTAEGIRAIVLKYKDYPEQLACQKENIRKIKKPEAVEELYNVVCARSAGPSA